MNRVEKRLVRFAITLLSVGSLAALATPSAAEADPVKACLDRLSNVEQRQCAETLYQTASAELDDVLHRTLEAAANAPGMAAAITKSQNAWIAYRDAECRGVVGSGEESGRMTWAFGCLAEKTLRRIQELKVPFDQR